MAVSIQFTFKHLEPTDAIKAHAEKKFEKIEKLLPSVFDVHYIFEVNKLEHKAELSCHSKLGHFVSHYSSDNLYTSIDTAVDKLLHQITKEKEKLNNH